MNDDEIAVNCGRCGRPLVMQIADLQDRFTIDCDLCATLAQALLPDSLPLQKHGPATSLRTILTTAEAPTD